MQYSIPHFIHIYNILVQVSVCVAVQYKLSAMA